MEQPIVSKRPENLLASAKPTEPFVIPSKDQQACLALSLGNEMAAVLLSGYYLETKIPCSLTEQFI